MSSNGSSDTSNKQELTAKKKAEFDLSALFKELNLTEGEVKAPPRKEPGSAGRSVKVDTNIYQIQTQPESVVYRYEVTMSGKSRGDKYVDLSKKSDSSTVIADRLSVCRDAFALVFRQCADFFGGNINAVFYDYQSILYTLKALNVPTNNPVHLIVERGENVVEFPGNLKQITMELKNVNEKAQCINLNDLSSILDDETLKSDRSVLNFIELAVNQYPMSRPQEFLSLNGPTVFLMDGVAHNLPEKPLDRGQTKYLASGVQKSATLIEGFKQRDGSSDPKQRRMGLMLETKHSPFHYEMSLLDCIQNNLSTNSMYADLCRGNLELYSLNQLSKYFRKLGMIVVYPNGLTRKIQLKGFDKTTANNHTFEVNNQPKSIAQYFYEKYNQPLQYPDAHLIKVRQGSSDNFYPIEFLRIADNNVVTSEQMDASSKAEMVRSCAVRPDDLKKENEKGAKSINLHNSEFSNTAGVKFSKVPLQCESRVLNPPIIKTAGNRANRVDTREAKWRMGFYYEPAQCERFCAYVLKDERNPMNGHELQSFIVTLQRYASEKTGLRLGECFDSGPYFEEQVEECVKFCADNNIRLCLFITPSHIKTGHSVMKMCEHRYNVVTQDVDIKTFRKLISPNAAATLENYMAKTNIKIGGLNHAVEHENPEVMRELTETMFIAISTNQPGSKSTADRVKKVENKDDWPGVLGYSANVVKNHNTFVGDFVYTQSYRPEYYDDLRQIFKSCVERFTQNRGSTPKSIVFYYVGASAGEFEAVYKNAVPLIRCGIKEGNNGASIPLTILAVQKTNNVRLFPANFQSAGNKDFEFNVPHGTVVDTTIVSPVFSEFFLVPHSGLKGTARIPRYSVLIDENSYSMDVMQGFSHALAYEHQIVSRTTALPTPIHVALGYAQRGRDVFKAEFRNHPQELPRDNEGYFDLPRLSLQLNYSRSDLKDYRVNA